MQLKELQDEAKLLVEATGCKDINELLAKFIEIEDRNFFQLEHVNKLSMEIEMERYEVAELQQELETYTGQKNKEATSRKNILETLEKMAVEASLSEPYRHC